jgi:PadR family transcriptional regulator AphA
MADLTTTSYVILGLLTSRDWSAYELAEQVGRGLEDVWARADRQRYYAAKKLEEAGLIEATSEAVGKRSRTRYSINAAGRAALTEWLAEPPRPLSIEFEGMVRVLIADQGTVADLRQNLEAIAQQARTGRDRHHAYAQNIVATGGTFPERQHTFALANRFMTGHFTHIVEWAAWALEEIETWPDTVSPAQTHTDRVRDLLTYAPVSTT